MQVTEIPSWLSGVWGITEAVAQVILSIVVIMAVLLPTMYVTRGKNAITIYVSMFFLCELFLVGVGWLPFWVLILTATLAALAVALIGSKAITGE